MPRRPTAPGSFWLDRDGTPPRAPLLEAVEADVVVIGGGIAGAFCALGLAEAGAHVVLLEGDRVGRGASGRNAGFLLAEAAETYAEVARTHGPAAARALRAAGLATRTAVARVAAHADVGLRVHGSLRLAEDAAEDADFRASVREVGLPLEHLDASRIPAAYRALGAAGALVDPGDGEVHPMRLLRATLSRAEAAGARLHERSPVTDLASSAGEVRVRTTSGSVTAEAAIVATNAWLPGLLPAGPSVRPVRAQMLAARVDPVPDWERPVYARRGGEYWRRLENGTVLLGGLRRIGGALEETDDARPAAPVQPALDALLRTLVGGHATIRVVARWAGTMGFTPDGLPTAGLAPGHDRVFVLGGFNGHGMGWGPGLADALAARVLGHGDDIDATFDPSRAAVAPARSVTPADGR